MHKKEKTQRGKDAEKKRCRKEKMQKRKDAEKNMYK